MKKKTAIFLLGSAFAVLLAFLLLTGSTMYKQNHAIPILEYHNLSELKEDNDWSVSRAAFNAQMAYLNENCRVVPLQDLLEDMRQGRHIQRNTVALTFDDGYRSNFEIAFPLLQKYNFPATIFITGKFIENGVIGDYPALTWEDMRAMQSSGLVSIQSHTYDLHDEIPDARSGKVLPAVLANSGTNMGPENDAQHDQRIAYDLIKSRRIIQEKLGSPADILCWPYGAYGKQELAIAQSVGFTAMTGKTAFSYPSTKPEDFARVAVLSGTTMDEFIKMAQPPQVSYLQAIELEIERVKYHLSRIF